MYQKNKSWAPSTTPNKAITITFDLLVKLLECGHLPKGAQQRPTKQDVLGISRVTSKAPRWRVTTWESCGPRVGASCLRRGPERRACIGHRRRAHPYCVDAITVTRRWSRLLRALLIVREGRDAIAATDGSVTFSIYTGTIVEVASPEAIGPAVLKVVKSCNAVRERYGLRELKATTLAHEYTLVRYDNGEKNSLAVLNLLELPEIRPLDPRCFGQGELKHPLSLKVDGVYVPASVVHVSYLLAPGGQCKIQCIIDSAVEQRPLFEHSACLIASIKLHEDSKPYHPKTGNPF